MDHSRPRPRAHVLPRLFPPWLHQGQAWLDPQWPVASQTSTATTQPPSTLWAIKASLGTAYAQLHVLLAGRETHTAHTHMYQVCAYFVSHYFKHLSRTHKHSDTVTQPSVIDSICETRALFFLGDGITVLNSDTNGVHICVPASACLTCATFCRTYLSLSQQCEHVKIKVVLMKYMC